MTEQNPPLIERKPRKDAPQIMSLFFVLMAVCVISDLFLFWARGHISESLGAFSCAARPYLFLAHPFFSSEFLSYMERACRAGVAEEPLFSLTFFMLKLNLSLLIVVPFWIIIILQPKLFFVFREKNNKEFMEKGGLLNRLKTASFLIAGLLLFCLYLFIQLKFFKTPSEYTRILNVGKVFEDIISGLLFLCMVFITTNVYFVASYFLFRRTSCLPKN